MAYSSYKRRTADVLRKTIQQLEADPTIDTADPSFVSFKCALLSRILQVETGSARSELRIHLVQATSPRRIAPNRRRKTLTAPSPELIASSPSRQTEPSSRGL